MLVFSSMKLFSSSVLLHEGDGGVLLQVFSSISFSSSMSHRVVDSGMVCMSPPHLLVVLLLLPALLLVHVLQLLPTLVLLHHLVPLELLVVISVVVLQVLRRLETSTKGVSERRQQSQTHSDQNQV